MMGFEPRQRRGVTVGGRPSSHAAVAGLTCLLAAGLACDGRSLSSASGSGGARAAGGASGAGGVDPGLSRGTGGQGIAGQGGRGGTASSGGSGGSTKGTGGTAAGGSGGSGATTGSGGASPAMPLPTDIDALASACVPGTIKPGRSPLRLLTRDDYDHTVRDLVGLTMSPSTGAPFSMAFPPEPYGGSTFSNNADAQGISDNAAESYLEAAEEIAAAAVSRLGMLAPSCDPATKGAMACATSFIGAFGKNAFRRPLTTDEVASYQDLFVDGSADGTYEAGIAEVIAAMLQSPHFLYRVEVSRPAAGGKPVPVSSYELATRLAYFVWGSMPDATLLAAADADQLGTTAALQAQVQRMVADPRAHDMTRRFHREWLGLDGALLVSRDPTLFPTWNDQVAADLLTESETFVDRVFWGGLGLATLFTAPYSYVNGNLAQHYGLSTPVDATVFVRVGLDPTQRAGILTQGAFLAGQSFTNRTSPTLRGIFLRQRILCRVVPPPPPFVDVGPPDPAVAQGSTRQRLEADTAAPQCRACHALFDPMGFALENFDAVGRWRTTDGNSLIDASGEIVDAIDPSTDGPFNGPVELMKKLATSEDVRACTVVNWFRWSSGRQESLPDDACSLLAINRQFQDAKYDMRALLPAIVSTDAFRYRSAGGTP